MNKKGAVEMLKLNKIRDMREDNDLTQKEISEKMYISKKTYERYENGERIPPIDFMIRLADFYNVTLDYLCGREPRKEAQETQKDPK